MADQVIDLIYTKYLKAKITYEHDVRVETYPFPGTLNHGDAAYRRFANLAVNLVSPIQSIRYWVMISR